MTAPASPRQVLLDLADRAEREEPSKDLDGAIGYAVGATPKAKPVYKRGHYIGNKRVLLRIEAVWLPYTTSLDAAVTLYPKKPAIILSDPKKVCAGALRARVAALP